MRLEEVHHKCFKKIYGFETRSSDWSDDIDVELGGFPEEEDWILYGPYSDKSLIRNKLTLICQIPLDTMQVERSFITYSLIMKAKVYMS